ncbi:DUF3106 domain-containing protein [Singulisphaera sp. PoT]|uniref:DUF3106 domain-containing protein n=1 Tax=Singulisphaera sp. PoT TaxID=3411797 RepID=UPI003BF5AF5E
MPVGLRLPAFALLIGLTVCQTARSDEEENWSRLRAIPREHREHLSKKLQDFDRLPSSEREAIRSLDKELGALPALNRANYQAILRRYHLWLASLPEDQRKQIESAPLNQRMTAVVKVRASNKAKTGGDEAHSPFQIVGPSPITLANRLQAWMVLSAEERKELERMEPADRDQRIREMVRPKRNRPITPLSDAQIAEALKKMKAEPQFTALIGRVEDEAKAAAAKKQANGKKIENTRFLPNQLRFMAENYHFLVEPPKRVESSRLVAFEAVLPTWFRDSFDHFTPNEATRRLTVLYRLIYGEGEMPPPSQATNDGAAEKTKKATAKKATPLPKPSAPSF